MLRAFACVVVFVAAACSHTVGAKVDANQFEKGKATVADVTKQLGTPSTQGTTTDSSGQQTTVLTYTWGTSGLGGYDVEATSFIFKNGVLDSTTVSKANSGQQQPPPK